MSGRLARSNVVAAPRRSASLAAPILAISAIAGVDGAQPQLRRRRGRRHPARHTHRTDRGHCRRRRSCASAFSRRRALPRRTAGSRVKIDPGRRRRRRTRRRARASTRPSPPGPARCIRSAATWRSSPATPLPSARRWPGSSTTRSATRSRSMFARSHQGHAPGGRRAPGRVRRERDPCWSRRNSRSKHAPGAVPEHWFIQPADGVDTAQLIGALDRQLTGTGAHVVRAEEWEAAAGRRAAEGESARAGPAARAGRDLQRDRDREHTADGQPAAAARVRHLAVARRDAGPDPPDGPVGVLAGRCDRSHTRRRRSRSRSAS